jgi:acyl-CoA synthetase (AMP-forming)/AMP-acid ligase II
VERYNVAQALADVAARVPFRRAIVFPAGRDGSGRARYTQLTFGQLNELCDRYAHGLSEYGIGLGTRTLMMAHPGIEFIAVAFALLKVGAVPVLIDPGMGRRAFLQCVAETEPAALVGIPLAHLLRLLVPRPFRTVRRAVVIGADRPWTRWLWKRLGRDMRTLEEMRSERRDPFSIAPTTTEDEGAIAFTSGSTGMPKGVVYLHGMFRAQIELLHDEVGYDDGEIDLPGLYVFALFNPALGATTILPDMDSTQPAQVNPAYLVEAIQTHGVTTTFGSPTIWKRVAAYCLERDIHLPSMKRILMAGAPVPPALIEQFAHILEDGDVYTPFGATEALPITMISGREILAETAELSKQGKGNCVGRPIRGHEIRVIRITDEPISEWDDSLVLPTGQVGEIAVKGPVVTRTYLNRPQETARAKIAERGSDDGQVPVIWHRMGDLGYFDDKGRLWFCGRKSHRVETRQGLMLPVPCEAIFQHPAVLRTALVGVGKRSQQRPVLVVQLKDQFRVSSSGFRVSGYGSRAVEGRPGQEALSKDKLVEELLALGAQHEHTRPIRDVLFHPSFPMDVRHNAKIQREKLAVWAASRLKDRLTKEMR